MPVWWLLRVLAVTVGVPFFMASTSSPLLLRWFARTNHQYAQDPYFLSVAGNLGSVFALLAYPLAVEPTLRLADQSWLWAVGYGLFIALTVACHWLLYRAVGLRAGTADPQSARDDDRGEDAGAVSWPQRLRWGALAFIPSSLMLGVTTYITTDIAPVALLWILPLTIYLLTFILVFTRLPRAFDFIMLALLIAGVAVLFLPVLLPQSPEAWLGDIPLAHLFPIQLGPVLSELLMVRHALYFLCFVLMCLVFPRLTHAIMVLMLPLAIISLLIDIPAFLINYAEMERDSAYWSWNTRLGVALNQQWALIALHLLALFVTAILSGRHHGRHQQRRHAAGES